MQKCYEFSYLGLNRYRGKAFHANVTVMQGKAIGMCLRAFIFVILETECFIMIGLFLLYPRVLSTFTVGYQFIDDTTLDT